MSVENSAPADRNLCDSSFSSSLILSQLIQLIISGIPVVLERWERMHRVGLQRADRLSNWDSWWFTRVWPSFLVIVDSSHRPVASLGTSVHELGSSHCLLQLFFVLDEGLIASAGFFIYAFNLIWVGRENVLGVLDLLVVPFWEQIGFELSASDCSISYFSILVDSVSDTRDLWRVLGFPRLFTDDCSRLFAQNGVSTSLLLL